MAHWAEIDENNVVISITVGDNNDPNGDEGYQWLVDNLGGKWIKTSYNGNIRKRYAYIGGTYSEEHDAFIYPKPFPSWELNTEELDWQAPVAYPEDGKTYIWKEKTLSWDEFDGN